MRGKEKQERRRNVSRSNTSRCRLIKFQKLKHHLLRVVQSARRRAGKVGPKRACHPLPKDQTYFSSNDTTSNLRKVSRPRFWTMAKTEPLGEGRKISHSLFFYSRLLYGVQSMRISWPEPVSILQFIRFVGSPWNNAPLITRYNFSRGGKRRARERMQGPRFIRNGIIRFITLLRTGECRYVGTTTRVSANQLGSRLPPCLRIREIFMPGNFA